MAATHRRGANASRTQNPFSTDEGRRLHYKNDPRYGPQTTKFPVNRRPLHVVGVVVGLLVVYFLIPWSDTSTTSGTTEHSLQKELKAKSAEPTALENGHELGYKPQLINEAEGNERVSNRHPQDQEEDNAEEDPNSSDVDAGEDTDEDDEAEGEGDGGTGDDQSLAEDGGDQDAEKEVLPSFLQDIQNSTLEESAITINDGNSLEEQDEGDNYDEDESQEAEEESIHTINVGHTQSDGESEGEARNASGFSTDEHSNKTVTDSYNKGTMPLFRNESESQYEQLDSIERTEDQANDTASDGLTVTEFGESTILAVNEELEADVNQTTSGEQQFPDDEPADEVETNRIDSGHESLQGNKLEGKNETGSSSGDEDFTPYNSSVVYSVDSSGLHAFGEGIGSELVAQNATSTADVSENNNETYSTDAVDIAIVNATVTLAKELSEDSIGGDEVFGEDGSASVLENNNETDSTEAVDVHTLISTVAFNKESSEESVDRDEVFGEDGSSSGADESEMKANEVELENVTLAVNALEMKNETDVSPGDDNSTLSNSSRSFNETSNEVNITTIEDFDGDGDLLVQESDEIIGEAGLYKNSSVADDLETKNGTDATLVDEDMAQSKSTIAINEESSGLNVSFAEEFSENDDAITTSLDLTASEANSSSLIEYSLAETESNASIDPAHHISTMNEGAGNETSAAGDESEHQNEILLSGEHLSQSNSSVEFNSSLIMTNTALAEENLGAAVPISLTLNNNNDTTTFGSPFGETSLRKEQNATSVDSHVHQNANVTSSITVPDEEVAREAEVNVVQTTHTANSTSIAPVEVGVVSSSAASIPLHDANNETLYFHGVAVDADLATIQEGTNATSGESRITLVEGNINPLATKHATEVTSKQKVLDTNTSNSILVVDANSSGTGDTGAEEIRAMLNTADNESDQATSQAAKNKANEQVDSATIGHGSLRGTNKDDGITKKR